MIPGTTINKKQRSYQVPNTESSDYAKNKFFKHIYTKNQNDDLSLVDGVSNSIVQMFNLSLTT
jgi:hypothetical protein